MQMILTSLLALLGTAGSFILSGYILSRGPKHRLHRAAAFLALMIGVLSFTILSILAIKVQASVDFWHVVLDFIEPIHIFALGWFVVRLTGLPKGLAGRKFFLWVGTPTLIMVALNPEVWGDPIQILRIDEHNTLGLFRLLRLCWAATALYYLGILFYSYRTTSLNYIKRQNGVILLGIVLGAPLALTDMVLNEVFHYEGFGLSVLGVNIALLCFAYGFLKYNLFSAPPMNTLSRIIDSMDEALFVLEGDVIRYVNRAAILLTGYEEQDLLGKSMQSFLILKEDGGENEKESFLTNNALNLHFQGKEGRLIPVNMSVSSLREEGATTGAVCLIHDMSFFRELLLKIYEAEKSLREKAEIIRKDMAIARQASSTFLPHKPPSIEYLECAYRFKPLDEIGGDFFSFRKFNEGGIGVFVGDVTGHGVAASLFLSMLRVLSDQVCGVYGREPAAYIQDLNQRLCDVMQSHFVTGLYALFEPTASQCNVTFARAGHPEPILLEAENGKARLIESSGSLMGIQPDTGTEEKKIELQKGDRIFIYTDGIVEIADSGSTQLSAEELLAIFETENKESLTDTVDAILERITAFGGNKPLEDDILLIGFEFKGS